MKIKNLTASTFVCLLPFIIIDLTSAEALNCRPPTTVIEMATDNATCPECLPCPPVAACKDGYSCQPDKPSTQGGEKQQYPTGAAEAWVQSVVDTATLIDVLLDDPRWGGRAKGEVYARENDNHIVWYWPKGGDATFDPTKLGSNAYWKDYRIALGKSGSGGPIQISDGMSIYFRDSGGGVSIFEHVGDTLPPITDFLMPYVNKNQRKVPANSVYPFGQQMWFSFYSTPKNQNTINHLVSSGMTLSGPHYSGMEGPGDLAAAYEAGLKSYWRLRLPGNENWGTVTTKMKTVKGRKWLTDQIKRHLQIVQSSTVKNNAVVAWYAQPEEAIYREGKPYSLAEQRAYLCLVRDVIAANDAKKRPYFASERTDSGASTMLGNTRCTSGVMKQNYLMRANKYDYQGQEMNERFLLGQWVRDQLNAANKNDAKGLSYTGKIRPVIATLSAYVDPNNKALQNETWLRKAITHDFYLSIAMGVHGVNIYTGARSGVTKKLQRKLYFEVIGNFSNAGLGKVFLWGDERSDISMQITSGPKTFTWNKYNTTHTEPSIKFRNIQYGSHRYILLVNSSKEIVTTKLSGFPGELRILDIISNKWYDLKTTVTSTIQPLGVRMYKITDE